MGADVETGDGSRAFKAGVEGGQDVEQRRLSRTVRTQQRHYLPVADVQRHIMQRFDGAEVPGDMAGFHHGRITP